MTLLMLESRGDLDANREKFTTASAGIDDSLMLILKLISLADHFSHMEFLVPSWHCYTSSNALSVRLAELCVLTLWVFGSEYEAEFEWYCKIADSTKHNSICSYDGIETGPGLCFEATFKLIFPSN
ncbi:hypothetical protein V6N13_132729 [Hibiscus sabdariffa]|uniref:Uncharacterized protein n=1 Tax=Hibiscus sabdariffa TaxID=183260 RepID=A0ABR2PWP2_9ROSI